MKKIVCILVMTLLIGTTITTIADNINDNLYKESIMTMPVEVPDSWLEGADQYQTDDYKYGMIISPTNHIAQEFKPTKEDLTAVALYFFDREAPPNTDIIVSIRNSLDGVDLTSKTINAADKNIKKGGTWVMFDFDDITVTPEETYYIICYASDGGSMGDCYCWFFDVGNKYDRGIAWESLDSAENWHDLENPGDPEWEGVDLCFITYYQEPPESTIINNYHPWLFRLIQRFPILESLLLKI